MLKHYISTFAALIGGAISTLLGGLYLWHTISAQTAFAVR